MKHEQDIQKEQMKGEMKMEGEKAKRSMLSEVETKV
jgi:hypothetical protein